MAPRPWRRGRGVDSLDTREGQETLRAMYRGEATRPCSSNPFPRSSHGIGCATVLLTRVTAVWASSLPFTEAPAPRLIAF